MNRNVESHFGNIPMKNIRRSKFKRPSSHKTTFNTGDIIPIYRDEMLPGDTCKMRMSSLVRMTTPTNPVMDNAWMDVYFFFIPRRLVWEHWKEFMGENTTDAWTQTTEYQIPQTVAPKGGWAKGSLASYLGARMYTDDVWIDSCYLRSYVAVYNEWFRNENLSEPAAMSLGDSTTTGSNGTDYVNDLEKGGMPAKAVKYSDAFTRALPEPQKGTAVYIPLGGEIPVIGNGITMGFTDGTDDAGFASGVSGALNMRKGKFGADVGEATDSSGGLASSTMIGLTTDPEKSGVIATLDYTPGPTINSLRMAYSIQKLLENDARGGTRYIELIKSHFGVLSPDSRQQRPEYLGGKRIPINMTEVTQTSQTDTTPMGDTAGKSLTIDTDDMFTFSSSEHGIIIGLAVVRTEHTYQQGIDRILRRKSKYDFYWPELASISEQPVYESELYAQGTADDDDVFGYQEPWYEYRYSTNRITGELNSDYAQPLDSWHYADDYSSAPSLSDAWVKETRVNVDRTLAVQDQDQFIADFYFDQTWIRPMPIYSVPGLTGWH